MLVVLIVYAALFLNIWIWSLYIFDKQNVLDCYCMLDQGANFARGDLEAGQSKF
jgi:hypothetical protein